MGAFEKILGCAVGAIENSGSLPTATLGTARRLGIIQ
jgi:hypothetical protein